MSCIALCWCLLAASSATVVDLHAPDPERAVAAAAALARARDPAATRALLDALLLGASPRVTVALLGALETRRDPSARPILLRLVRHRNPDLRRAALAALAALPGAASLPPLRRGLRDPEPEVRQAAATLLAARRDAGAAPDLFALFQRGEEKLAPMLGAVAPADLVPRLADLVGAVPDAALCDALQVIATRSDLPDALRAQVVQAIIRVPGDLAVGTLLELIPQLTRSSPLTEAAVRTGLERRGQ